MNQTLKRSWPTGGASEPGWGFSPPGTRGFDENSPGRVGLVSATFLGGSAAGFGDI